MADPPEFFWCQDCTAYVPTPERVHDGCGGHNICPRCQHEVDRVTEAPFVARTLCIPWPGDATDG